MAEVEVESGTRAQAEEGRARACPLLIGFGAAATAVQMAGRGACWTPLRTAEKTAYRAARQIALRVTC